VCLGHRGKQLDIEENVPEPGVDRFGDAFLRSLASEAPAYSESGAEAISTGLLAEVIARADLYLGEAAQYIPEANNWMTGDRQLGS
jgi:hypothetical protein